MSSKRGRKRNDNLPPNRARDVQRAFRARRAAHLLALEQRVTELEVENAKLRKIAGWGPDLRLPLGRGPTGKDKPKFGDGSFGSHIIDFFPSRGSESAQSSSRTGSLSPSALAASSTMHVIDPETWEGALTISDNDSHEISSEPHYQLPPPVSSKSMYPSYGNGIPSSLSSSSSRSPMPLSGGNGGVPSQISYSNPNERHLGTSYNSQGFISRESLRVDSPRQHYAYQQPFSQSHDINVQSQTPPPFNSNSPHVHPHHRSASNPFPNRRSTTEHYAIGQNLHLPDPSHLQMQQPTDQSDMHRLPDGNEQHQRHQQQPQQRSQQNTYAIYGVDGAISSMP